MTDPLLLRSVDEIDLNRHGVIEASAGTGKTYTIERLVTRMLREGRATIDEILVVTFTEKAAQELRHRIRSNVQEQMADAEGETKTRLAAALQQFEQAAIHTIHGFCHWVLREYAFERGAGFDPEVVSDPTVALQALREVQGSEWPRLFGEHLHAALRMCNYPDDQARGPSWEDRLITLALRLRFDRGDRLLPEVDADQPMKAIEEDLSRKKKHLKELVGPLNGAEPESNEFYKAFSLLNFRKDVRQKRLDKIVLPMLRFVAQDDIPALDSVLEFYKACREFDTFKKADSFRVLYSNPNWFKSGDNTAEVCPSAPGIEDALESIRMSLKHAEQTLMAVTIPLLQKRLVAIKSATGEISYNDMISHVEVAMRDDANSGLAASLRKRFRIGLIDEFQDTDSQQWSLFQSLFLQGESGRLFVIGDPKQAIYSFRGADIHTYFKATDSLLKKHDGLAYTLGTNYRSLPGLIDAMNSLFSSEWFPATSDIQFQAVSAPDRSLRNTHIYKDDSGRAPISLISLANDNVDPLKAEYAKWVAAEIKRLLTANGGKPLLQLKTKSKQRLLQADDICILTFSRKEMNPVTDALREQGIAYSIYKQEGIFQSVEAMHWNILLAALAEPDDPALLRKALLTRFFDVHPETMLQAGDDMHHHPAVKQCHQWAELAAQRHWPRLLHAILYDSGLALREMSMPDGERRWTNMLHVSQELEAATWQQSFDAAGLSHWLSVRVANLADDGEGSNLHRIETEQPKVQIMTIHASKGLEFPVVFVAGGFSPSPKRKHSVFHDDDGMMLVDLCQQPQHEDRTNEEMDHEKRRLFYVACTRAAIKLYLPRTKVSNRKSGPLQEFIRHSIATAWPDITEDMPVRHVAADGSADALTTWVPDLDESAADSDVVTPRLLLPEPLWPVMPANMYQRSVRMDSFSKLKSKREALESTADSYWQPEDEVRWLDDDDNQTVEEEDVPVLIPGATTGTALHTILETIDFVVVGNAKNGSKLLSGATGDLIQSTLASFFPAEDALTLQKMNAAAADLVWNSLQAPLVVGEDHFRLCELTLEDRVEEMEFHFPMGAGSNLPDQQKPTDGYLHGFIDFLFRRGDRYYIADWKSNRLSSYDADSLQQAMTSSHYDLQYKLYSIATCKWLRSRIPNFDYDTHFGGAFYFFLRGMQADSSTSGIFYDRPSLQELNELERSLATSATGGVRV